MNLQQTVSKILGKEVSVEEAMKFANEQYGVLCQYNRELDIENDRTIYPKRAEKYAEHQHFLGTRGKDFVNFDDWKHKK